MRKVILIFLVLLITTPTFAEIVKKPTIEFGGGYRSDTITLGSNPYYYKTDTTQTVISGYLIIEVPMSEKMEFVGRGEVGFGGGTYASGGFPSESFGGSAFDFSGGLKIEL